MRNFLIKNFIVALVISGMLTPTLATALAIPAYDGSENLAPGQVDPLNYFRQAARPKGEDMSKNLAKWREEDQKQCEIEAGGKNKTPGQMVGDGFKDLAKTPLKNAVGEQLTTQAIPNTLAAVQKDAYKYIGEDVKTNLNEGLKAGLKEELPQTLSEKLKALQAEGITPADVQNNRGMFTNLVQESIRETLPDVLNEDFVGKSVSNSISSGLRRSLQENLRVNLGQSAKPTIELYYRNQVDSMLTEIPNMIKDQVEQLQGTIQGTIAGVQALVNQMGQCFNSPVCIGQRAIVTGIVGAISQDIKLVGKSFFPEVEQAKLLLENMTNQLKATIEFLKWITEISKPENRQKMVEDLIKGFSMQLERSLTEPQNIAKLSDAITGAISGPINAAIEANINQVVDSIASPISAMEDAIDTIDEAFLTSITDAADLQISIAIATLTKPATLIVDHMGDSIATAIDNTLGAALYPTAAQITSGAFGAGGVIGDGINKLGFSFQDLVFPRPQLSVVPDGFTGALAPGQMLQADFDTAQLNGVNIIPDNQAPRPGMAEMHYSDYLASAPSPTGVMGGASVGDSAVFGPVAAVADGAAQATTEAAPAIAENAVSPQVGAATGATGGGMSILQGGFTNVISGGITAIAAAIPGAALFAPMINAAFTAAVSTAGMAPVGGGLPVADAGVIFSTKFLIQLSQGISSNTGKTASGVDAIKDLNEKLVILNVQACTNLKVLRRIQLLAEDKTFVMDPAARKSLGTAIAAARDEFMKQVNQGYSISEGTTGVSDPQGKNKQPLFVTNTGDHVADAVLESNGAFLDRMKEIIGINPHIATEMDRIREKNASDFQNSLQENAITKEEYDNMMAGNFSWDGWLKLIQPNGNPAGVNFIIQQEQDRRAAEAAQNAREEIIAGGGYLGPRECEEQTASGYCLKWKTLTPASTIRDQAAFQTTSAQRQAELGDAAGEEFIAGELPIANQQVLNLQRYEEQPSQSYYETLDNTFPFADIDFSKKVPTIDFKFQTPTSVEVASGTPNQTTLTWNVLDAERCEVAGYWPTVGMTNPPIAQSGTDAGFNATRTIQHPVKLEVQIRHVVRAQNINVPEPIEKAIDPDQLVERARFNANNGVEPVGVNDMYQLVLGTTGAPMYIDVFMPASSATPLTAQDVIQAFYETITDLQTKTTAQATEVRKYIFTFNTTGGFMSIRPKLEYRLRCVGSGDTITKHVNITRQ